MNAQKKLRLCGLKIQGITPYPLAWADQRSLVADRIANPDTIFLNWWQRWLVKKGTHARAPIAS